MNLTNSAQPSYATKRDLARQTIGSDVGAIGARLGFPLMPWQQSIADIAGELDPDGTLHYRFVVLIVGRRAGKTSLLLPTALQRAQWIDNARIHVTQQNAQSARTMFRDDWVDAVAAVPDLGAKVRLSNGSESIKLGRSTIDLFTPSRTGLHGKDSDLCVVDEAWAFSSAQGEDLEAAIRPTMLTRPNGQTWIISAGGDQDSGWLLEWRSRGRKAVDDPNSRIMFVEYSPPVDAQGNYLDDLDDPATWERIHPAVGVTIPLDALKAEFESMDRSTFYRTVLSVFQVDQKTTADSLIDPDDWDKCKDTNTTLGTDPGMFLSYDIAPGRNGGSIVMVRKLPDGRIAVQLTDHNSGVAWIAPMVAEYVTKFRCRVVADSRGHAVTVTRALYEQHGIKADELTFTQMQNACAELLDDTRTRRIVHQGQPELSDVIPDAIGRVSDRSGAVLFDRRDRMTDISPVVAMSIAAYSARHAVASKPAFYFA